MYNIYMKTKLCRICGQLKPQSGYAKMYKKDRNGNDHYRSDCKQCQSDYQVRSRQAMKARAVEYKGDKCEDCGRSYPARVYDFHHRVPDEKAFTVALKYNNSWAKIKVELDKCALLCSNCHRIHHIK